MSNLNSIVRRVLLNEARGRDGTDLSGGFTDPAASAAAAQTYIDFTKSLGALALDTIVYFRSGQVLLDALTVMTPLAHAPKDEKETQTAIAATSLHTLLNNLGTAGLDAADVVNGGVYMLERNYKMAALCLVAAIPIVGSALIARKAGKFAIAAADVSKVDAKIVQIKSGLRAAETPGAEATIKEIEKLRADMNSGVADFNPYDQIPDARKEAAESVAADPEKIAAATESLTSLQTASKDTVGDLRGELQSQSSAGYVSNGPIPIKKRPSLGSSDYSRPIKKRPSFRSSDYSSPSRFSPEELYDILAKHKKYLNDRRTGEWAYLVDADLRGFNLIDADLRAASLSRANLKGADLMGANLDAASLDGANLAGANLEYAGLRRAQLSGANLKGANLMGADLSDVDLTEVDLTNANLRGAKYSDRTKFSKDVKPGLLGMKHEMEDM